MAKSKKSKNQSSEFGRWIFFSVLVIVFVVIGLSVNNQNHSNQTPQQHSNEKQDTSWSLEQQSCLIDAETKYQDDWKAAGKDGDGN